jgi:hypothetical protein
MHDSFHFGHDRRGEIISAVTAGLTIAILVYTVRIARLNEARVINGAKTNNLLAVISGKISKTEGEIYEKL